MSSYSMNLSEFDFLNQHNSLEIRVVAHTESLFLFM